MAADSDSASDPDSEPGRDLQLEEFRDRLADPEVTVADTRSAEAFAAGHIPGTISLPLEELLERASEILPDLNAPIVFYCGGST